MQLSLALCVSVVLTSSIRTTIAIPETNLPDEPYENGTGDEESVVNLEADMEQPMSRCEHLSKPTSVMSVLGKPGKTNCVKYKAICRRHCCRVRNYRPSSNVNCPKPCAVLTPVIETHCFYYLKYVIVKPCCQLDVCLMVDKSGSMNWPWGSASLKKNFLTSFVAQLQGGGSGGGGVALDGHVALVTHGRSPSVSHLFTDPQNTVVQTKINSLVFSGGDNYAAALKSCMEQFTHRPRARRVLVALGDGLSSSTSAIATAANALRNPLQQVDTFAVFTPLYINPFLVALGTTNMQLIGAVPGRFIPVMAPYGSAQYDSTLQQLINMLRGICCLNETYPSYPNPNSIHKPYEPVKVPESKISDVDKARLQCTDSPEGYEKCAALIE